MRRAGVVVSMRTTLVDRMHMVLEARRRCLSGVRVRVHCLRRRGMRCILHRGWSITLKDKGRGVMGDSKCRVGMLVTSRIKLGTRRGMMVSRDMVLRGTDSSSMEGRVVITTNNLSSRGMVEGRVEVITAELVMM
jgi:hypothetical protein